MATSSRQVPDYARLRAARRRAGLTQAELATKIGREWPETISRFESGHPRYVTAALTREIADALGVKLKGVPK